MDESPRYRPLYQQVYDFLVKQIAAGEWAPGQSLPSEQALAGRLNVSQGTVRKALDALATDSLIDRRQGKGTYVAEHTQERALFRFFRMARPGGPRVIPSSGRNLLNAPCPAAPENPQPGAEAAGVRLDGADHARAQQRHMGEQALVRRLAQGEVEAHVIDVDAQALAEHVDVAGQERRRGVGGGRLSALAKATPGTG